MSYISLYFIRPMKIITRAFKLLFTGILLIVLIPNSQAQTEKKLFNDKDWTSLTLPQNFIYMMGGNTWDDFYNSEKIIGITGNAFFLNNVIAIDFKNKSSAFINTAN